MRDRAGMTDASFLTDVIHPDLVLNAGDLTEDDTMSEWAYMFNTIGEILASKLTAYAPGNHESTWENDEDYRAGYRQYRRALEKKASYVILVHNHPSGDPTPSGADMRMTRELVDIAKPLGIAIHDHIIVGRDGHASFKGLGLI